MKLDGFHILTFRLNTNFKNTKAACFALLLESVVDQYILFIIY